jgi:hypothetical protein
MNVASVIVTSFVVGCVLLDDINILTLVLPRLWSFALWLRWDELRDYLDVHVLLMVDSDAVVGEYEWGISFHRVVKSCLDNVRLSFH